MNIKGWSANYFADKAIRKDDTLWKQKRYSNETMDSWLHEEKTVADDFASKF